MNSDPEVLMRKGKPWFSFAALSVATSAVALGCAFYFSTRESQSDLDRRLIDREKADVVRAANDVKTADALTSIAGDLRGLHYDVNTALLDRWTGTDMKFTWQKVQLFWSEFSRLNPTVNVPPWPDAKRVSDNDAH